MSVFVVGSWTLNSLTLSGEVLIEILGVVQVESAVVFVGQSLGRERAHGEEEQGKDDGAHFVGDLLKMNI